jgi:hypothetical protein
MSISPKFLIGMVLAIGLSISLGLLVGGLSVPKNEIVA